VSKNKKHIHPVFARAYYAKGALPIYIVRAQKRPHAHSRLSYHQEIEFQLIKSGTGAYFIGGKTYPFTRASLLIIKPRQVHSFIIGNDSTVEKAFLFFAWSSIILSPARFRYIFDLPVSLHLEDDEFAALDALLRQIELELERRAPFWQDLVRAKVVEWLLWVRRISQHPAPPPAEHPVQEQLLAYLERHCVQPVPIPKIAADFGYSGTYLTRLCKQFTGLGIKQYLLQRRIIEAQKLLIAEPQWTVAAVADRVGFSDFGLFNRIFKKMTGATPSEYRRIYHLHVGK
jgi:AraC-like DNA-binding protein